MELLIAFAVVVLYVFSAQWRKFVNVVAGIAVGVFVLALMIYK